MNKSDADASVTNTNGASFTISPSRSPMLDSVRELIEFRELLLFLTWKDVKVQFAQTILGLGWLILRPLLNVIVLTLVFGRLAKIPSEGQPYLLFAFSGVIFWGYFSTVVAKSAMSLVGNAQLLTKIYFPRMFLPMSIALSGCIEFFVTLLLFLLVAGFGYGHVPGPEMWLFPLVMLVLVLASLGVSLWLSALAIDFRDVRHASAYLIQLLMFLAPLVWPASLLAERMGDAADAVLGWYAFYPMVGVIEGGRYALLGGDAVPWQYIVPSAVSSLLLVLSGAWYFRKRERLMADLV
ncbi:MAG: ABC transporter permease [Oceanococcus sp.]